MAVVLSPHRTSFILNDIEMIEGLSEDEDCIMFPDDFEFLNDRTGATGDLGLFATGRRGGEVTLKYLPHSEVAKTLMVQAKRALSDGVVTLFDGSITNTDTGVSAIVNGGAVKKHPLFWTMGMGNVSNMPFVFIFEEIIPDWEGANFGEQAGAPAEVA